MTDVKHLSERIDMLEARLAHREQEIEELNGLVARQWQAIDDLTRRLGALGGRMQAVEERTDSPDGVEPPPPHY
ncbi:MAG: SlyX family protein [Parvibaculum sp.]|nr:SlyX family protein [Parvibaculum sp.]